MQVKIKPCVIYTVMCLIPRIQSHGSETPLTILYKLCYIEKLLCITFDIKNFVTYKLCKEIINIIKIHSRMNLCTIIHCME